MVPPVNDEVSASTWTATLRGFNEHPNTPPSRECGSVKRERERFCANTSSVRVRIYVTEADVGRCPYVHITIERSLRHLCLGIYCVA